MTDPGLSGERRARWRLAWHLVMVLASGVGLVSSMLEYSLPWTLVMVVTCTAWVAWTLAEGQRWRDAVRAKP